MLASHNRVGVLTVLFWCIVATAVFQRTLLGDDKTQIMESVITRMKASRDRLHSGMFDAEGQYTVTSSTGGVDGKCSIFCAFDFSKNVMFCDHTAPALVAAHLVQDGAEGGAPFVQQLVKTRYVRTPEARLFWTSLNGSDVVFERPENARNVILEFDARLVGLASLDGIRRKRFEELFPKITNKPRTLLSAQKETETVYRLEWQTRIAKRLLWIDEAQGFSPVRLEIRAEPKLHVDQVYSVEWMQVADVWVPKTFTGEEHNTGGKVEKYDLHFKWRSVNQPVESSLVPE